MSQMMVASDALATLAGRAVANAAWKKESRIEKVRIRKSPLRVKGENESTISASISSLVKRLEPQLRNTFDAGRPWDDLANVIQCKHCKKPLLLQFANEHITTCITKKNEKAQRKKEQKEANRKAREAQQKAERAGEEAGQDAEGADDDSVNGDGKTGKKSAIKGISGTSKKRKADEEADKGLLKKKTKKELEAMKPKAKPRGPVDVERQCGVVLANGQMCARSLTCKSHSMGAKRAVPGRSMPYNMLLAAYNKKNQAKQQKAAMDANALPMDEDNENDGPVDSDEEKDLVMAGIARSQVFPIAQHCPISMRRKYQFIRVRDMIRSALGTGKAGLASATAMADTEETENPRASFSQPPSARPSIVARKASLVTTPGTPIIAN